MRGGGGRGDGGMGGWGEGLGGGEGGGERGGREGVAHTHMQTTIHNYSHVSYISMRGDGGIIVL